jgi:hypothetical protein
MRNPANRRMDFKMARGMGFVQGIAQQQPFGDVLAHAPRNNPGEMFPSCPCMDRCCTTHARWRNTTEAITWYPVWRNSRNCVSSGACLCHGYITRFPEAPRGVGGKRWPREVSLWRFNVWEAVTVLYLVVITTCECSTNRFIWSRTHNY